MKRIITLTFLTITATAVLLAAQPAAAVDYTTAVPLPQLGTDTYYGQQGGLWPGGQNQPPPAYAAELTAVSNQLANDSQVVVLSLGMSMMQNASNGFIQAGYAGGGDVSPAFRFVNGAIGSKQQNWVDPNNTVWGRGPAMLGLQGLNEAAVDVVIYHNGWAGPSAEPFPQHAITMKNSVQTTMGIILDKYPNTKLILVANRHYALSATSKHPEPFAYEEGFSWKWLVENRINCTVNCGPPIAWLTNQWVPDWVNHPEYYVTDGLHLSPGPGGGQYASAEIWREAMINTSYIAPWYLAGPVPTATATAVPTQTQTPTSTPTGPTPTVTNTPSPSSTPTVTPTAEFTPTPTATAVCPRDWCPPWWSYLPVVGSK